MDKMKENTTIYKNKMASDNVEENKSKKKINKKNKWISQDEKQNVEEKDFGQRREGESGEKKEE